MSYIDEAYYTNDFCGTPIPSEEFARLARAASDLIDAIVYRPIETITENVRKATAYQLEMLSSQGGVEAITGFASAGATTERLGDYSVSRGASAGAGSASTVMLNGIPVSRMAVDLLRRDGLMSRWVYAGVRENEQDA